MSSKGKNGMGTLLIKERMERYISSKGKNGRATLVVKERMGGYISNKGKQEWGIHW